MKTTLPIHQKGELSLLWVAVSMAGLAALAMAGLFWMRYERNVFAEGWAYLMRTSVGATVQQTRAAAEDSLQPESSIVRKCMVDGKVVYSNVDCSAKDAGSRVVKLHDTRGIEAPKVPPAVVATDDAATEVRRKMIEKATPN